MIRSLILVATLFFSVSAMAAPLEGKTWGGHGKHRPSITFEANGKVTGFAGCNQFFATYKRKGRRLSFGPVATTRKFCEGKAMKVEKRFLKALEKTKRFKRRRGKLILKAGLGRRLFVLRRAAENK